MWRQQYQGLAALVVLEQTRALLLKPQTYMNRSGQSVRSALAFYKLDPSELVVVHDELDLSFGQLRLKFGGGDAGHNGLRSVSESLSTREYVRLRVGIDRPPAEFAGDAASYVLEGFAPAEQLDLEALVSRAADAITLVVRDGLDAAMNQVNRRNKG